MSSEQAILDSLRKPGSPPAPEVLAYEQEVALKNQQFAKSAPADLPFKSLGKLISIQRTERGAVLQAENGYMSIAFLMADMVQIRIRTDNNFGDLIPFSYAVEKYDHWNEVSPVVMEDPASIVIGAGSIACRIERANMNFSMFAPDGTPLIVNDQEGFASAGSKVRWTRRLLPDETCHGLGQRPYGLNLRGEKLELWNQDPILYRRGEEHCYYSIPFYFGFQEKYALGLFWDNPSRGSVDLGKTHAEHMTFEAESGELRVYIMAAVTADVIMDRYTMLTGRPTLPPLWSLGYQQCRWSYLSTNEFRELMRQFRQRRIPCDVLYFDIDYMDGYRCFTHNQQNFADLKELLGEFQKQGFKAVAILDPALKDDPNYFAFDDGIKNDIFVKYPDGSIYKGVVWAGTSAFPDFTNPKVRSWWADKVAEFIKKVPFDGIWNDMNEPVVFTSKIPNIAPDYLVHDWEGQKINHSDGAHNVYGMQMARSTREGLEKARPDKRPFTLTRAGFAGVQRYASSWTGDNLSTWDHVKLSISMLMNLGLSGVVFSGPDIGGFGGEPDAELYTRWLQLGSVLPYFRSHTMMGTARQEPWSFGAYHEAINRKYIELRYRLLPYFYSAMAIASQQGLPFIRPGFFHDRFDSRLRTQDDAFLVGENMFVAPIVEPGATSRTVYLPRGAWYDFWTNRLIDGAREITVEAPLDTMPIFYRAGRVLPLYPIQQFVGESKIDEMTLRVFAGTGETTLYEDAGEGNGFKQGDYRFSYFTASFFPNGQYGVDWRVAGKFKPNYERVRVEVVGIPGEPNEIEVDHKPAPLWFFENGMVEVLGPPFKEFRLIGRRPDTSSSAATMIRRPPR